MWQKFIAWLTGRRNTEQSTAARTPTRGVRIVLDKPRHLRFSLGTMEDLQNEFGSNALGGDLSGKKLARIIWHGLKWEDPQLTPEAVAELVDMEHLTLVTEAMAQATGSKKAVVSPLAQPQDAPGDAPAAS